MNLFSNIPSSFRDPSGFLFTKDKKIYRQINISYKEDHDHVINSGLYKKLVDLNLLIPHKEVDIGEFKNQKIKTFQNFDQSLYKIIEPEVIPFISYPYEWCFSMLKDAALLTLKIQKIAHKFGMSLKDSSSYNIQFKDGKPILIDTLSFERYKKDKPWTPYRQFCQHFLAPLALISYCDIRLNNLLKTYIDGIPLDLASKILPSKTYLNTYLLTHIHLHAKSQKIYASKSVDVKDKKLSQLSFEGLIENLISAVEKLTWKEKKTDWSDYYHDTNYSKEAFLDKKKIISNFLDKVEVKTLWDIGANIGIFSYIAGDKNINTISFDIDPLAVEINYRVCRDNARDNILPLILDMINPSPAIGWENKERLSLLDRTPVDMVFALALIHHLVISNNLSFTMICSLFSKITRYLIIEFVPKDDSQVKRLLSTREDIFSFYSKHIFEGEFKKYFNIIDKKKIESSKRELYLMEKKT